MCSISSPPTLLAATLSSSSSESKMLRPPRIPYKAPISMATLSRSSSLVRFVLINLFFSCVYIYIYMLGLVLLNPIVWCYVWYYVWHYVWHDVWLNIVINKVVLLLSEIMVTWIFGQYHIVHEMHSMWFMWKVTEDINHKFFVNSEFSSYSVMKLGVSSAKTITYQLRWFVLIMKVVTSSWYVDMF